MQPVLKSYLSLIWTLNRINLINPIALSNSFSYLYKTWAKKRSLIVGTKLSTTLRLVHLSVWVKTPTQTSHSYLKTTAISYLSEGFKLALKTNLTIRLTVFIRFLNSFTHLFNFNMHFFKEFISIIVCSRSWFKWSLSSNKGGLLVNQTLFKHLRYI